LEKRRLQFNVTEGRRGGRQLVSCGAGSDLREKTRRHKRKGLFEKRVGGGMALALTHQIREPTAKKGTD